MPSASPTLRTAAFFDLDDTLIDGVSGILYARFERREGRISGLQMGQALLWGVLYRLSLMDIERAFERALAYYRGVPEATLRERTVGWFEADVAHLLRPGALPVLAEHRAAGRPLVLLTNSSPYMAEIACRTFGLDDWLSNYFNVDEQGSMTGGFERPLCYGAGKVARAQVWCDKRGIDLGESWFYSDSLSDLAMLERVAKPRVVHPDPRLRRLARQRGWPVLEWGDARAAQAPHRPAR